jgi:hypothetical protein
MAPKGRTVDLIDQLPFPISALAIAAEYLALKNREKRARAMSPTPTSTLSGTHLPVDPLVPIGFEAQDSKASLSMLAGKTTRERVRYVLGHPRWRPAD